MPLTTLAVISGPLSDRMWSGTPLFSITSAKVSMTPKLLIRRATRIARHSRVNSSINVSRRSDGHHAFALRQSRSSRHDWIVAVATGRTIHR